MLLCSAQFPGAEGVAEKAISEAGASFDAGHGFWFLPLMGALTDPQKTHAGIWVERLVCRLLDLPELRDEPQYRADLAELARLRCEFAPQEKFYERAEEVWYRGAGSEQTNKAISKLFGLVAHELYPKGNRPLHVYSGVVCNLVDFLGYRPEVFALAVEEFRSIWQLRQQGMAPNQVLHLPGAAHYGFVEIASR
jgi:hypothetical protein